MTVGNVVSLSIRRSDYGSRGAAQHELDGYSVMYQFQCPLCGSSHSGHNLRVWADGGRTDTVQAKCPKKGAVEIQLVRP